ncbi:Aldehyde dehydrogenase [Rhizopus stolonifer]|uniref:Aldehyde dehydrogenase n=1 Tax=Rhizopus stolonifer TaxID=4846 RepID=A0A367KI36_RHIST|nr:Aldehyde dehydrogenase [Rhizopus stolonifer]
MSSADLLQYTSFESIEDYVSHARQIFLTGKPRDMNRRKQQIQQLYNLVHDNEQKLCEALVKDMNRPQTEALTGDIAPVLDECLYFLDNLDKLAQDEKIKPRSGINSLAKVVVRRDPLGVVLILGSWNYPLSLVPLVGAIAAGNTVILKLSEVSVHTAALITKLFPKYMDTSCYRIVNGGVPETTELLKYKFDHIFYTGNHTVAKIIMTAAAKHLTPVTLELGGKSPAVILDDTDIQLTANRIAWGKFYNAGQICIAVDYVLCPQSKLDAFVSAFKNTLEQWYGSDPQQSKDYGRIVSERHAQRISDILTQRQSGDIVIGGQVDIQDRYIAPTLVVNVKPNDPSLMRDEIFGPVLPVITYNHLDEVIGLINQKNPPLALYIFSQKEKLAEKVLKNTQSGGVCINDCLTHQAEYAVPFGGVGTSGMGNYHGIKSYQTFTHERSMLIKKQAMEKANNVRYPPYTERKYDVLRLILVKHPFLLKLKAYKSPLKLLLSLIALLVFYLKRK